ncbi:glycosyltransferase family 2 protein [Salegentibacter mishustinae]|uniref:Glycosyl transferase family 2 n=1 Tax=Salegentibacter mishustinae TaxID=270918 RepID=A0A0Q9ZHS8_9FLAO|nr:glycosyltransferase [Salegentibacter mishustinae]KRG28417.1 glycosyl transferase family 2 [Salegentibacter mishustinae]PNW22351.1 glycosyl transferase family 2 [Salegentibacter mishustinae]PZX67580.1 GT2 family glycosyltransferase [Salegentibacter mishustinae]GGW78799.1 glycosyl transferase family 2 [Salegentibacter mishustinae]
MKFNLIICTYQRSQAIERLLESVREQKLYPDEILVIDASPDDLTKKLFEKKPYPSLKYYKVGKDDIGLTRQRNFGVKHSSSDMDVFCFLDDDIVLEPDYFENLVDSYIKHPGAIGIGGRIKDDIVWKKVSGNYKIKFDEFQFDGFARPLGQRNVLRKRLGLLSGKPPGFMPEFSHGFSTGFLPPSEKIYPVEFFMGGVASYKHELFSEINFSEKFIGYGLYEDLDFCLRASAIGQLYVNTAAKVEHLHDEAGRPDYIKYGRMVVENGYHVWKLKNPNPSFKAAFKFWAIHILLLIIRFVNGFSKDKSGFDDARGRLKGLIEVIKTN